jgi:hypothetical protein
VTRLGQLRHWPHPTVNALDAGLRPIKVFVLAAKMPSLEIGVIRGFRSLYSACAFELTRRVAGNVVTAHAGFANINALTELLCIKIAMSLGNASSLLNCVFNLFRASRNADRHCHQNDECS